MDTPSLESIQLKKCEKFVLLTFKGQTPFKVSCAYLRYCSPSAENRINQTKSLNDFQNVRIIDIQPIGHYAIKFLFDDGHRTGLYPFRMLYRLAQDYAFIHSNDQRS